MHRVDRNEPQAQVFIKDLVGGNISAPALQAHLHVQLAAFGNRGDINVLIQDFDIAISFNHAGGDNARLLGLEIDGFRTVSVQLERDLLQVEDNVGGILDYA